MIQYINSRKNSSVALIIVAIIAIPFAFFGVTSVFQSGVRVADAAEVNGHVISMLDLQRGVRNRQQEIIEQLGENADPRYYEEASIRPAVLGRLIREKLFIGMLKDNNIGFSENNLKREILDMPQFHADGKFSQDIYQNTLLNLGFTTQTFLNEIEDDYIYQTFLQSIRSSSFNTQVSLDNYIELLGEKRNYTYLKLPVSQQIEQAQVTPEEIKAYFEENQENYRVPDQVVVKYISVDSQALLPLVKIDSNAIQQRYELKKQQPQSELLEAAHILVEPQDDGSHLQKIQDIQEKIQSGESFESLASNYSDDFGSAANGGNLGFTEGETFPETFESALAALEVGQVSTPVETDSGIHLIKLVSRGGSTLGTLEEETSSIVQELVDEGIAQKYTEVVEDLKDRVYVNDNLEEVVVSMQDIIPLTIATSEPFPRQGGEGLMANPNVVNSAFSDEVLNQKLISNVIEITGDSDESNTAVAVQLQELQPSYIPELEVVSNAVELALKQQKASVALEVIANDLMTKLQAGNDVETLAMEYNVEWQAQIDATRNSYLEEDQFAFSIHDNQLPVVRQFTQRNDDKVVLRLDSKTPGSREDFTQEELNNLSQQRAQSLAVQALIAYQDYLMENADIDTPLTYQ